MVSILPDGCEFKTRVNAPTTRVRHNRYDWYNELLRLARQVAADRCVEREDFALYVGKGGALVKHRDEIGAEFRGQARIFGRLFDLGDQRIELLAFGRVNQQQCIGLGSQGGECRVLR